MDFVFDRTAEGRVIKCLTIVDDATHEAVAIEVERAISGHMLTLVLDRLALGRGLPRVIRTDNGKEFCGKISAKFLIHRLYRMGIACHIYLRNCTLVSEINTPRPEAHLCWRRDSA